MESMTFVLLAALHEEANAILDVFAQSPKQNHEGSTALELRGGHQGHLVYLGGPGRVRAAVMATRAIQRLEPTMVLLVGTAGGFQDQRVQLGDLIVATSILDYEHQRLEDDDEVVRLEAFETNPSLLQRARRVASDNPAIHFGPVFSGDKVIASGRVRGQLRRHSASALGVEMEGSGVAVACGKLPLLMIRGVSDHANARKSVDHEVWRSAACRSAAQFARRFLEEWIEHTNLPGVSGA